MGRSGLGIARSGLALLELGTMQDGGDDDEDGFEQDGFEQEKKGRNRVKVQKLCKRFYGSSGGILQSRENEI